MATRKRRSVLTADQQQSVRAKMMKSAATIASQLDQYIEKGHLHVAGKSVELTSNRLAAWRLILDRTVPTLSNAEITHKREVETLDSNALLDRLTNLAKARPDLAQRLQEAIGGKVIDVEPEPAKEPKQIPWQMASETN